MKVWIKLLAGSIIGIILGFFLPADNQQVVSTLIWLEQLALGIGRYAVIPILVFSLTVAIYELRQDGQFWPLVLKNFLVIIGASLFVISAGILVTLIFPPARIPILIEEQLETISLNVTASSFIQTFIPQGYFIAWQGVYTPKPHQKLRLNSAAFRFTACGTQPRLPALRFCFLPLWNWPRGSENRRL